MDKELCEICGTELHRRGNYAVPTVDGRSHASKHHYVPERFFGRSKNRRGEVRHRLFDRSPWGLEGEAGVFYYDCHEELLHNPVLLPADIEAFAELVQLRGLDEPAKSESREKLAGRVELLHDVIALGVRKLLADERSRGTG